MSIVTEPVKQIKNNLMNGLTTHFINNEKLPLVIEPTDTQLSLQESLALLQNNSAYLKQEMLNYGGLLFRNFPIEDVDGFIAILKSMGLANFADYVGGDSPRTKVKEGVFTSTEAPPDIKINLHNELSFVNKYPKHIHFYCQIPPQKNGETIIGDSRKIYWDIDPEVRNRFEKKGLKYVSNYYNKNAIIDFFAQKSHKTWHQVFDTNSKEAVEKICRENDFGFRWHKNEWLQVTHKRPATIEHPITKEKVWFNQAPLFDLNPRFLGWFNYLGIQLLYCRKHTKLHEVYFGDNSKISQDDIYHIMDVLDKNTIYFSWQKGDVLMLDNVLSMHGRATFTGKRRILTAMSS